MALFNVDFYCAEGKIVQPAGAQIFIAICQTCIVAAVCHISFLASCEII